MKRGQWINTPRFLKVKIERVFKNRNYAAKMGFTEPTHYDRGDGWDIFGKHIGINLMIFAAVQKQGIQHEQH